MCRYTLGHLGAAFPSKGVFGLALTGPLGILSWFMGSGRIVGSGCIVGLGCAVVSGCIVGSRYLMGSGCIVGFGV